MGKRAERKVMLTLNVFKKERTTKEGKKFPGYLTRITNKESGEMVSASLKFEDGVDVPKTFPIRIDVIEGSVSNRTFTDKNGEEKTGYTVWVRNWKKSDDEFVDNSLNEWA